MVSHLFYYQFALLAIIWLFVMLHLTGATPAVPAAAAAAASALPEPLKSKRQRSNEPKPSRA